MGSLLQIATGIMLSYVVLGFALKTYLFSYSLTMLFLLTNHYLVLSIEFVSPTDKFFCDDHLRGERIVPVLGMTSMFSIWYTTCKEVLSTTPPFAQTNWCILTGAIDLTIVTSRLCKSNLAPSHSLSSLFSCWRNRPTYILGMALLEFYPATIHCSYETLSNPCYSLVPYFFACAPRPWSVSCCLAATTMDHRLCERNGINLVVSRWDIFGLQFQKVIMLHLSHENVVRFKY